MLENISYQEPKVINNHSMEDFYESFLAYIQTTETTKETYAREIRQFLVYLQERAIKYPKREDIINYVNYLTEKGLKPSTVQNYVVAVKQLFNWLEIEYNYKNIAKGVKGAKVSKGHKRDNFSLTQVAKILQAIDMTKEQGRRDYAIIVLMVTTALRTIEVSRANVDDIRNENGQFYLYVQGKGHNEKDTPVRLTETAYTAINHYLRAKKDKGSSVPLFTSTSNNNKGGRMTARSVSSLVKKRFRDAGFDSPRLTAHSLRHTGITEAYKGMKEAGIADTLSEVQKYARHTNPATSQIYIHEEDQKHNLGADLVSDVLDKAMKKIKSA